MMLWKIAGTLFMLSVINGDTNLGKTLVLQNL